MRRKIFENKIVRKSIVWAMTFMMAFSSVGGSLTVFAEDAPKAVEEVPDMVSSDTREAAKNAETAKNEAVSAATEETVPHAATISFTLFFNKNVSSCIAYFLIV